VLAPALVSYRDRSHAIGRHAGRVSPTPRWWVEPAAGGAAAYSVATAAGCRARLADRGRLSLGYW